MRRWRAEGRRAAAAGRVVARGQAVTGARVARPAEGDSAKVHLAKQAVANSTAKRYITGAWAAGARRAVASGMGWGTGGGHMLEKHARCRGGALSCSPVMSASSSNVSSNCSTSPTKSKAPRTARSLRRACGARGSPSVNWSNTALLARPWAVPMPVNSAKAELICNRRE